MEDIIWNIPCEQMLDRLDELYEYLRNFPESKLAPAIRSEIAYLEPMAALL